jgi:D-lyxose ketol-isomerase
MKRSAVNSHIRDAKEFIAGMRFALPPFAYWSPDEWKYKGPEYDEVRRSTMITRTTSFWKSEAASPQ